MRANSSSSILLCTILFLHIIISTSTDTITLTRSIRDGESLVSAQGVFKLGFFSPGSNERRYVGILYNNISFQAVWVANREKPLLDSSGVLKLTNESVLVLVNGTGTVFWSTNSSRSVQNPIAQLYDSGNLVVRDHNDENEDGFLWQSFDYPCDTQLPGMKIGKDLVTGFERSLTSWKSSDDPSPGSYTYRLDPRGYPQPVLLQDSVEVYREGPWNGVWFSENSLIGLNVSEKYQFVFNDKEVYYVYDAFGPSDITNRILYTSGTLQRVRWDTSKQTWDVFFTKPIDTCDVYEVCGENGICDLSNSVQCQCMKGFVPKSKQDWDNGVWSDGCVHGVPFNCSTHNGFLKYSNVKLPDARYSWFNTTMTLDECKKKCLGNCSCVAYANLDVTNGGTGCLLWFSSLVDAKVISGTGQDLYVRVASSRSGDGKKHIWIAVGFSLLAFLLIIAAITSVLWRKRRLRRQAKQGIFEGDLEQYNITNNEKKESELPIFAFNVIENATNFFSNANKLGEGGFGPVYKGTLSDGQEIAVKRLSTDSRQGMEQFKNEAIFIAKLQHRNLVKLMGCCTESEEQILIYEYMPNKSLDHFIFDKSDTLLDWPKQFEIIKGIARGLLYLHQDSRLRIVHRDLKASNILLDSEMNAKISDFGMARSFDGSQEEAKTRRVVGTYGYMPPEYTIDGLFSVKSDVFSFGVLVLEIVSGKRNRGFNHPDHHHNLLGHIWMLFREDTTLDAVDPLIKESSIDASQMQRTIHIGLLCVQQHPEDRPSMSLVTVMLSSNSELPEPKEPGFFVGRNVPQESVSTNYTESVSNDEMTITLLSGR